MTLLPSGARQLGLLWKILHNWTLSGGKTGSYDRKLPLTIPRLSLCPPPKLVLGPVTWGLRLQPLHLLMGEFILIKEKETLAP